MKGNKEDGKTLDIREKSIPNLYFLKLIQQLLEVRKHQKLRKKKFIQ